MNTSNNTVLVTGGSAGIGFEIAKLLSEKNNHVIITGRNKERLNKAASKLSNVTAIASDVSKVQDIHELAETVHSSFPNLNMVINNAGNAFVYSLANSVDAFEKAQEEMLTNYLS